MYSTHPTPAKLLCAKRCEAWQVVWSWRSPIRYLQRQRNIGASTALHANHLHAQVAPCANETGKGPSLRLHAFQI